MRFCTICRERETTPPWSVAKETNPLGPESQRRTERQQEAGWPLPIAASSTGPERSSRGHSQARHSMTVLGGQNQKLMPWAKAGQRPRWQLQALTAQTPIPDQKTSHGHPSTVLAYIKGNCLLSWCTHFFKRTPG